MKEKEIHNLFAVLNPTTEIAFLKLSSVTHSVCYTHNYTLLGFLPKTSLYFCKRKCLEPCYFFLHDINPFTLQRNQNYFVLFVCNGVQLDTNAIIPDNSFEAHKRDNFRSELFIHRLKLSLPLIIVLSEFLPFIKIMLILTLKRFTALPIVVGNIKALLVLHLKIEKMNNEFSRA